MPERICTSSGDGKLDALDGMAFPKEDELQALIAEHPELLDGEHIRPGDARRWILVTREKGIAPPAARVSCELPLRLPSSCTLRRAMGLEDDDAKIGERSQRPLNAWSDLAP